MVHCNLRLTRHEFGEITQWHQVPIGWSRHVPAPSCTSGRFEFDPLRDWCCSLVDLCPTARLRPLRLNILWAFWVKMSNECSACFEGSTTIANRHSPCGLGIFAAGRRTFFCYGIVMLAMERRRECSVSIVIHVSSKGSKLRFVREKTDSQFSLGSWL